MKIIVLTLCLALGGSLTAGEVQWGNTSTLKDQENTEFTTKDFTFKDISPSSLSNSSNGGTSFFDKVFSTGSYAPFDKEYTFSNKEYKTNALNFYKEYPTKDLDLGSRVSSLSQDNTSIKMAEAPWASREVAPGFTKQIEMKEYDGPEAKLIKRDITEIYKTLNSMRKVPDHDLSIEEVRNLLNKDDGPALKFTDPSQVNPSGPSNPKLQKTPLQ